MSLNRDTRWLFWVLSKSVYSFRMLCIWRLIHTASNVKLIDRFFLFLIFLVYSFSFTFTSSDSARAQSIDVKVNEKLYTRKIKNKKNRSINLRFDAVYLRRQMHNVRNEYTLFLITQN